MYCSVTDSMFVQNDNMILSSFQTYLDEQSTVLGVGTRGARADNADADTTGEV